MILEKRMNSNKFGRKFTFSLFTNFKCKLELTLETILIQIV